MNAIYTMALGERHKSIFAETVSLMRGYAGRIDARFHAFTNEDDRFPISHYRKLELMQAGLRNYERVAWIDCDVLISKIAESIFDEVPEDKLGLFNEAPWVVERYKKDREQWFSMTGLVLPEDTYYNTGIMVASKKHLPLFEMPELKINYYGEQTFLNQRIHETIPKEEIFQLSHHWNRMSCTHYELGEEPFCSNFIHFAGDQNPNLPQFIRQTVEYWQKQEWHGFRRYNIITNLGMGNQIAAVPAIEYLMKMQPEHKFTIHSYFPEVYEHLREKGVEVRSTSDMITYPFAIVKSTAFNGVIQDVASHPIDYHSQALLGRQIPFEERRVTVPVEDCGFVFDSNTICIHAGKSGWASKEMPQVAWQDIVDRLKAEGFRVATIGARVFTHKNKLYKEGEVWGCFKLRNVDMDMTDLPYPKTCDVIKKCPYLLTNDSMPVHAAGAFDNHIGLLTIAKRPEFILPYRHERQDFKTQVWTGVPLWKVRKEIDILKPGSEFRWDKMQEGMKWPEPERVVRDIVEAMKK